MEKTILGDFTLIKSLGRGTLGETWLAEHRFIKRQYVVKLLPETFSKQTDFLKRFERDMSSLASLDHPNVARIHNVSFADGRYFLVTDYIHDENGESFNLASLLQDSKKTLSENEIFHLLLKVASGLSYIHQQKMGNLPLAHRNLKLSNILLRFSENGFEPVICDVGLTQILGEAHILTKTYQALSQLAHNPAEESKSEWIEHQTKLHISFYQSYAFLAPEQKIFRNTPPSAQCDIYSFGVLTYFLLLRTFPEGYFPFISEMRGDYQYDWDELIKACLDPSPSRRPSSLKQVMSLLQRQDENVSRVGPLKVPAQEQELPSPRKEPSHLNSPKQPLQSSEAQRQVMQEPYMPVRENSTVASQEQMHRGSPYTPPGKQTHYASQQDLFASKQVSPKDETSSTHSAQTTQKSYESRSKISSAIKNRFHDFHQPSKSSPMQDPLSQSPETRSVHRQQGDSMYAGADPTQYLQEPQKQASLMAEERPMEEMRQDEAQRIDEQEEVRNNPTMIDRMSQYVKTIQQPAKPKPVLKPQEILRPIYEQDPGKIFQMETTVAPYRPKEKEVAEVEPILTDMVVIKGGEYSRGSEEGVRDERPRHKIFINDFAMDIHAVTNEQFSRFLEVMGGEKDSNNQDIIRLRESRIKKLNGKLVVESGYSKHPVVGVTWYGAVAYAKWVGKRLPTEAEYEIAARGGLIDAEYPTGHDIDRSQANFFSSDTAAVMSYPPNGYGLYDIAGNVYEWCNDWYGYDYYEMSKLEPENPKGPYQGVYRVLRGGCWKSLKEDMRCSHRHRNNPATINRTYGFRCAADVVPQ